MDTKYTQINLDSLEEQLALEYNSIAAYVQMHENPHPSIPKDSGLSDWPKMEALVTGSPYYTTWMSAATILQCTVAFALTFAIVFTNLMVLLVRTRNKKLRKQVSSYFIKSLAISDLCVGLFQSVPGIASVLFLDGHLGYWWIKLSVYGTMTASAVSMYAIICISLDRYIAVTNPLRYYALVKTVHCRLLIFLAWLWSLVLMLPIFTPIIPTAYTNSTFAAVLDYARNIPFVIVIAYVIYVPTGLTLLVVYMKIMKISRRHVQQMERDRRRFSINPELVTPESVAKRTKYLRNSLFIIVTWFLTWVPRGGYIVYEIHVGRLEWADFVTLWLTLSNNFTHAMIYNWFHKDFRKALKDMCLWCPFYDKKKEYKQLVYSINAGASV